MGMGHLRPGFTPPSLRCGTGIEAGLYGASGRIGLNAVIRTEVLLMSTCLRLLLTLLLVLGVAGVAGAQGTIVGQVTDAQVGNALPGAQVRVVGTRLEAIADRQGLYRIPRVPPGEHTLEAAHLGFDTGTATVTVVAGSAATARFALKLAGFEEEVVVTAPILEGQAKALSQQQNAVNIINVVSADQIGAFPDPNAAEAVQRVPGVTIERDQGEGRYVLVRGTEARLNSMMINGERIPSPEGDIRSVALDVIPADLLESIEVSKALTPDMDADAIGGAVNLVTAQAPEKPRLFVSGAGGYNHIGSGGGLERFNATWARRFAERRAGLVLSGSYLNTDRGSENFEVSYDGGALDDLQNRHYTVNRERWGLNGAFDYRLADNGLLYLRGIYNNFADQEYRRRLRNRVGNDRLERELKDRLETQEIASVSAGGRHFFGYGLWSLDYSASWSYGNEDEPDAVYTTFRQSKVQFAPNVTPDFIDPDNIQANPLNEDVSKYKLNEQSVDTNFTSDRDLVGAFNVKRLFGSGGTNGFVKLGAKYRDKHKMRDNRTVVYEPAGDVFLSDYADPGFSPTTRILDGRYTMGPFIAAGTARSLLPGFGGELDPEADLADYDAKEKVAAGYAMAEINLGDDLMILPGVRYEHTELDYTGYEVLFDANGDYESTQPLTGTRSYGDWLPNLQLRYRVANGRGNVRAAFTRTLARPNYYDLVPYELVLDEDLEIEKGNSTLAPTRSWNFDLLYEHFLPSVGVVSAGFFRKRLDDYIYLFTLQEPRNGDLYRVRQPLNGDKATLTGFELALQNRLSFLPSPLDGLGFYGNYTYSDSEAQFPDRQGEKASLPGQSKHVGNVALTYEKGGFSGRVALNFHGKFLSEVGETPAGDIYYDNHAQLDVAASQRVAGGLRLFLELNNLTNEPLRYYEGSVDRPIQEEYYSWWGAFGLKWDF
jgi:TonB-dependent receptor